MSLLFASGSALAQKVANYNIGKLGSTDYEHFSFWVMDHSRIEISYIYGKNDKEYKITYLGKSTWQNKSGFRIKFSNGFVLNVIPDGLKLHIISNDGKYDKSFSWEYEGPVNGIGTFCDACAQDDKEAIEIIKKYYLR